MADGDMADWLASKGRPESGVRMPLALSVAPMSVAALPEQPPAEMPPAETRPALAPATPAPSMSATPASILPSTPPDKRAPAKQAWPDRLQQGNELLRQLVPDLVADIELPGVPGYDSAPFLVAPRAGAKTLVITFGGNTGFLMLPQQLTTSTDTHLIAMRDPIRCFGLCGIPGLGATYVKCIENLRRLIAALGATHIYCAGVSAGGYPALRYGLDLEARGVLAFSAPTTLDVADDNEAPLSRYPQLTALYKRRQDLSLNLDMARSYAEASPRPGTLLIYSPSNARDTWLASRMAGIAGVSTEAVSPEAGHRVFLWLNNQNLLASYINRMRALERVA